MLSTKWRTGWVWKMSDETKAFFVFLVLTMAIFIVGMMVGVIAGFGAVGC